MRRIDVREFNCFDSQNVLDNKVRCYTANKGSKCANCGEMTYWTNSRDLWVGSAEVPVAQTIDLLKRWGLLDVRKNKGFGCSSTPSETACRACAHTITHGDF